VKTVQNPEHIEKIRQEIMRFRELLDVMQARLEQGEGFYAELFANLTDDEKQGKKEKDLQTLVAYQIADDLTPFTKSALRMRFANRDLERAFEELHDTIITPPIED